MWNASRSIGFGIAMFPKPRRMPVIEMKSSARRSTKASFLRS